MGVGEETQPTEDCPDELKELELARPWPRLWARTFDMIAYALPLGLLLGLIYPELLYYDIFANVGGEWLLGIMLLPLVMMFDAAVLSLTGTSPGKAIAGLSVKGEDLENLPMDVAIRRNIGCYIRGLALGIPIINLVTYMICHGQVKDRGYTAWDDATNSRVLSKPNDGSRTVLIAVCVIVVNGIIRYL